jgi:large subunit ribosomal protein L36
MKVKTSLKKRGKDSKIVKRQGRLFVINKNHPRFKQRQS